MSSDFEDIELNNVNLRPKRESKTRHSLKVAHRKQAGWDWSDVADNLNQVHDFWIVKVRKSTIVKSICWITLLVLFIYFYFLDAFNTFNGEKTSFSFHRRRFTSSDEIEVPVLVLCTNPGYKASVLNDCEFDEFSDAFLNDDFNHTTPNCTKW